MINLKRAMSCGKILEPLNSNIMTSIDIADVSIDCLYTGAECYKMYNQTQMHSLKVLRAAISQLLLAQYSTDTKVSNIPLKKQIVGASGWAICKDGTILVNAYNGDVPVITGQQTADLSKDEHVWLMVKPDNTIKATVCDFLGNQKAAVLKIDTADKDETHKDPTALFEALYIKALKTDGGYKNIFNDKYNYIYVDGYKPYLDGDASLLDVAEDILCLENDLYALMSYESTVENYFNIDSPIKYILNNIQVNQFEMINQDDVKGLEIEEVYGDVSPILTLNSAKATKKSQVSDAAVVDKMITAMDKIRKVLIDYGETNEIGVREVIAWASAYKIMGNAYDAAMHTILPSSSDDDEIYSACKTALETSFTPSRKKDKKEWHMTLGDLLKVDKFNICKRTELTEAQKMLYDTQRQSLDMTMVPGKEIVEKARLIHDSRDFPQPFTNVLWEGESGTGKTTGARVLAQLLGLPYYFITMNPDTMLSDLYVNILPNNNKIGKNEVLKVIKGVCADFPAAEVIDVNPAAAYRQVTGVVKEDASESDVYEALGKKIADSLEKKGNSSDFMYVVSDLIKSLSEGGVCEIQEANLISKAGVLGGINACLDDIGIAQLPTGETITRHKNSIVVMTMNAHYEGTKKLNEAVRSRFPLKGRFELPEKDDLISRIMIKSGIQQGS